MVLTLGLYCKYSVTGDISGLKFFIIVFNICMKHILKINESNKITISHFNVLYPDNRRNSCNCGTVYFILCYTVPVWLGHSFNIISPVSVIDYQITKLSLNNLTFQT